MPAMRNHARRRRCLLFLAVLLGGFLVFLPAPGLASPAAGAEVDFQSVEDASDIWSWKADLIRRYHKVDGSCSYYWAPLVYAHLTVTWDEQSRTALYFLDGNRISAEKARSLAKPGSGFSVGSTIPVGAPRFCLKSGHAPPPKVRLKKDLNGPERLKRRYQQKYHPDCWQFTALALTRDSVWVAVRSIPLPPKPLPRFSLPNGFQSPRHFQESPAQPIQGGIVRIDRQTGEWVRFTEKNGLPDTLRCRSLSGESNRLPHLLPSTRFSQEVVAIRPLVDIDRICFITRSQHQVWYDEKRGAWVNGH